MKPSAKRVLGNIAGLTTMIVFVALTMGIAGPAKEVVRVIGADSMAHTVTIYADEFGTDHQNCTVLVSGGASQSGWEKLVSGDTEIAMLSNRPSKSHLQEAKAKGIDVEEGIIGWGGIVLITHPSNPVTSLTSDQLTKLLTGQYSSWKDVGGPDKAVQIVTVGDEAREEEGRFIMEELAKGTLAPSARRVAYFRSIPPTVAQTEGALGLIRMRNLERLVEQGQAMKIKVIAVKRDDQSPAISPSRESVDEGTYPIARPFFIYTVPSKASKPALEFFRFCAERNPRVVQGASSKVTSK